MFRDTVRVVWIVRSVLAEEVIFEDRIQCAKTVAPADFFTFLIRSAMVADADLVDDHVELRNFGGDLGFEAEAVLLDCDPLEHLAFEDLVAGLHVGEVEIGEHVGEQREEFVTHHVPEIDDAVCIAAGEAGAKDDVGLAALDRREQLRVFVGVVFEIGVLHDDHVAGRQGKTGAQRRAFALVDIVVDNSVDQRGDLGAEGVSGAVDGTVVDNDDLLLGNWCGADAVHDGSNRAHLVVAGDDDGKFHDRSSTYVRLEWTEAHFRRAFGLTGR